MLNPGTLLQSRYRIAKKLGEGGMGAVYRAWDVRLDASAAIKEMVPQPGLDPRALEGLRQQFRQEAVVLARLSHPNLVRVTDFFEEDGSVYLVMDFVEGENLAERIAREGAQDEHQVITWAEQLLDALAYCHGEGILHRDIKPQNVVIRPDGRAVLVDFGLVKLWDPRDPRTQTVMRGMGTPEYAPPEQYDALGQGHTAPSSDIYSLGATLYHALTGHAPPTATMRVVNPDALIPLRQVVPHVSNKMEQIITQATQLQPRMRYQSAQEMRAALAGQSPPPTVRQDTFEPAVSPDPTRVMPDRPVTTPFDEEYTPPAPPPRRKRAWLWWVAGAGALLLCGAIVLIGGFLASMALTPPTPTITPRPTSTLAPTATATPRPTLTPTPQDPDNGDVDTWPVLLSDTFVDNATGWSVGDYEGTLIVGHRTLDDGRYEWHGEASGGVVWSTTPSMPDFRDFSLILEGQLLEGSSNARYGVLYHRKDADNYHMFRINNDHYQVQLRHAGEWYTIIDWTSSEAIQSHQNNRLEVIGEGDIYYLYINGVYVNSYLESRLPTGRAGIVIGLAGGESASYVFTFFELRAPQD